MIDKSMFEPGTKEWIERAVRAETALKAIRKLCEESHFGGWRFKVAAIVDQGLDQ